MKGHLVIPHLLADRPAAASLPATPALNELLRHATHLVEQPATDITHWLARLSSPADGRAGFAALSARADGLQPGRFWLRLDPVHMMLHRDHIRVIDARLLELSRAEADCLVDDLNQHFAPDSIHFVVPHPKRWYVGFERTLDVMTTPILAAAGQSADPLLPRGPDGLTLSSIINEAQMLLYHHPLNAEREARGLLPINGVWAWGEGVVAAQPHSPFDCILTSEETGDLFARACHKPAVGLPENATAWLANHCGSNELIILDSLSPAAQYNDYGSWLENLAVLEANWFAPLWQAFRKGRLADLRLTAISTNRVDTFVPRRPNLWSFLKKKRTLSDFLPEA